MKQYLIAALVAVSSTLSFNACAASEGQSTVGEYVDDATITTRVKTRFAEDSRVSAMRISVETLKGEVQLSGFAATQDEKNHAADIAARVPGVSKVRNNIVVRTGNSGKPVQ